MKKQLFLGSLVIAFLTIQIKAQWSANPGVNTPICNAANNQEEARVVSDGVGSAIMAWRDARSGTDYDIYAQRVDASGVVRWPVNGVGICTAAGHQQDLVVISDSSGGAILAWSDYRGGSTGDIYAQRINGDGVVQWATNGVAIRTAPGDQRYPAIISDGSGGAIIAWEDSSSSNSRGDIYAQRINAAGVLQWTTGGVAVCKTSGLKEFTAIASDNSGGAILAWRDFRSGSTSDIYAQRINAAGVVQWIGNGVGICTIAGDQSDPSIVSNGLGSAIVGWLDYRNGSWDIYAQRIDSTGVVEWTAGGVAISTRTSDQIAPIITSDGSGGAILAWADLRIGTFYDIYAQRINAAGVVQWAVNGEGICTAANFQMTSSIVSDGFGGAIISWSDNRTETAGTSYDVYAQRINSEGMVEWTRNGVAISSGTGNQFYPMLTSIGSGSAILTWSDYRSGNWDIYAQNVCGDGSIGGTTPLAPASISVSDIVCAGSTATFSIPAVSGASSYAWLLPDGWTGTSDSTSITATASSNGGTVTVIASNACGPSPACTLAVKVRALPAAPGSISGSPSGCLGSTTQFTIKPVSGATSYAWALPEGWEGTSNDTSITAEAGPAGGTVTVAAENECGTSESSWLPVAVESPPSTLASISGSPVACTGGAMTYSIPPVSRATSYAWTLPSGWSGASGTSSITATVGETGGNVTVIASNRCGNSSPASLAVSVPKPPPAPASIIGSWMVCEGKPASYSIPEVNGATSYKWTLPAGWKGVSAIPSITATAGAAGGNVRVTASNPCGSSPASILAVSVELVPSKPVAISGSDTVCTGTSTNYGIPPVNGATSYSWTLPGGWTGSSSTNSIHARAGATGGNVTVAASNACGDSPADTLAVRVLATPSTPASISGSDTVCAGSSITYIVPAVSGATSYHWTLPVGWQGGSGTGSILVTADSNSGNVMVVAMNACGTSPDVSLSVTSLDTPGAPAFINGSGWACAGSQATYSIHPVDGATSYTWTVPGGWRWTPNATFLTATVGSTGGSVTVTASNACGTSPATSQTVTVTPCVGMEEPEEGGPALSIFPNPNQGEFTIASTRKGVFSLYNSLGQEIQTYQFHAPNTTLTVSRLQQGVYFLVGADGRTAAEKIVVFR